MDARQQRRLVLAGYGFAVGSGIHMVDHLRRGQTSVTAELNWLGTAGIVIQVAVITLIVTRHRIAPLAAVAAGFPLAAGFFAVHWLPHWSVVSDPLSKMHSAVWFSYLASTLEVAGALAIAIAGLAIVCSDGLASFGTPRPAKVAAHPS